MIELSNNKVIKANPFNHALVKKGGTKAGHRGPMVQKIGQPYSNKAKATNRQKPKKRK